MRSIQLPLLIGHRGLMGFAPENTLASFKYAHEKKLQWIEFDVNMTHDGVLIICHDHHVARTTNGSGNVIEMDYQQISQLDAGSWFSSEFSHEFIPTLEQTLAFCQSVGLNCNIELKPDKNMNQNQQRIFCEKCMVILKPYFPCLQILFSSFDIELLIIMRSLSKQIHLGLLVNKDQNMETLLELHQKLHFYSFHFSAKLITPSILKRLKPLNVKILVFTVNNKTKTKKLIEQGVDAIFTNQLTTLE